MKKTLWFALVVISTMLVGCPPAEDPVIPTGFTDCSRLRVSGSEGVGDLIFSLSKPSTEVVYTPREAIKLWLEPLAVRDSDTSELDVQWEGTTLKTVLMQPNANGGWREVVQFWDKDPDAPTPTGANRVSLAFLTPAHPLVVWPMAGISECWRYFPYPHSDYRWWSTYGYQPYWDGYYWSGANWLLRADLLDYPVVLVKSSEEAVNKSLVISDGKWLQIDTAQNMFWVDIEFGYSVSIGGQTWYESTMSRIWFDNDEDGISNWTEVQEGTDPNDPDSFPGSPVAIPSLTGMTEQQARAALTGVGFTIGTVSVEGSLTPAGIVIRWNPTGSAPRGTAINLVISTGPALPPVQVPDLTGMTEQQARTAITGANLTVGPVTSQTSSTIPSGRVISWSPTGSVARGTAISIVISNGAGTVATPNLTGMTEQQARAAIIGANLTVGTVTSQASDTIPSGIVVSWSPMGQVAVGTAINIVVSSGSSSQEMSVKITAPVDGRVFTRQGGSVTVTVKVLSNGRASDGPYKLVVRDAEAYRYTVEGVTLGVERSFTFTLTVAGSGNFAAALTNKDCVFLEDVVPYSVE
ncbi:MAG: PASTA domain-containing protein [Candidatus Paceibacterota bacterium]|jgi:beta-lactam-binding protein with PASTA domain